MSEVARLARELATVQTNILTLESEISSRVADFQSKLEAARQKDAELRAAMLEAMEAAGGQPYEDDHLRITYVKPSKRKGIDTTRLQLEHPDIYQKYLTETNVKASIRIKVK